MRSEKKIKEKRLDKFLEQFDPKIWYYVILLLSLVISVVSILFMYTFSHVWAYEQFGVDNFNFFYTSNYFPGYELNFRILDKAVETSINIREEKIEYIENLRFIIISAFLLIIIFTIIAIVKQKETDDNISESYENTLISITGVFVGISFGLASGSYLLLISLSNDYLSKLHILISQGVPFEALPITTYDPTYQILCIGYIGFAIISILLLTSLLLRIVYIKLHYNALKFSSNVYLLTSISLSFLVFWLFTFVKDISIVKYI